MALRFPKPLLKVMRSVGALLFVVSVPGCLVMPPMGVVFLVLGVGLFGAGRLLDR